MARTKNNKGRFVKAGPKPTAYEYRQELVPPEKMAFDRDDKAREGWEPDPTWSGIYELRGRLLVLYRRKKG